MSGEQRAVPMLKFADLIDKHAAKLAELDSISMGTPVAPMGGVLIPETAAVFRYYAGWADKIEGESFAADDGKYKIVRHEPLGVCAGIAPWNAPVLYIGWKIAPALAAGNTFIFKSSEKSPLSALFVAKLVVEAGFPPGVIQFISGAGKTGGLLASHMKIQKISFTGSTFTGKIVSKRALESNMKKVTLELGGKSAALVFADADIPNAVGSTADGFLFNSGQVCIATSRLLVQESIAPAFIDAVKERFRLVNEAAGADPLKMSTAFGPLADKAQFERVLSFLSGAKEAGETPIIGGNQHGTTGYFVEPTIFVNPDKQSRIYREEIFGPVLTIRTFKTEAEAIELANDTDTGLSAQLYTSDVTRALRVASLLETGNVSINEPHLPARQAPFGGYKESGSGKELGKYGLQQYLQTKTILVK